MYMFQYVMPLLNSVADTYLGSGAFLTPGSGIQNMFFRIPDLWARNQNAYIGKLCDNFLGKKFQCCGSGMFILDPRSKFFPSRSQIQTVSIPDPASASKNLIILIPKEQKKWFPSSRKYDPGCSSRIPDPETGCWLSTCPGSRGQKGIGSRIWIRNTEKFYNSLKIGTIVFFGI